VTDGFVAVLGRLDRGPERFEGHTLQNVPFGMEVCALTLLGCDDMQVYFRLAESLVTPSRPMLIVTCLPEHQHQASWVLRAGRKPHAFLASQPDANHTQTPEHFAGIGESWVDAPLLDGLAMAGLSDQVTAAALCGTLGHHAHR
jgi:hypothetical protein